MEREKTIGYVVRMLSNLIKREVEKHEAEKNSEKLTGTHGWAIGYFYSHRNEDVYQRDFEAAFNIRRSTATQILKLMEKNGLIKRVSVAEDKRLRKIILTEKSIRLHNEFSIFIEDFEQRIIEDIPKEDLEIFYRVVYRIKENIENIDN